MADETNKTSPQVNWGQDPIVLGKKQYTTGTVHGPVPPEYMDTENLRAQQREAKAAGLPPPDVSSPASKEAYIRGEMPVTAPVVKRPSETSSQIGRASCRERV